MMAAQRLLAALLASTCLFGLASPVGWSQAPSKAAEEAAKRRAREQEEENKKKAHEEAVKRALELFDVRYKSKDETTRAASVDVLATVKDPTILSRLLRIVQGTETDAVKIHVIRALGGYPGNSQANNTLTNLLSTYKKKPDLMVAVLEAVGEIDCHPAVSKVIDLYRDNSLIVARAAIVASARIRDRASVDPLLKMLKEFEEFTTRIAQAPGIPLSASDAEYSKRQAELDDPVRRALTDITLQSFQTVKEWDTWWRKNKGSFKTDPEVKR